MYPYYTAYTCSYVAYKGACWGLRTDLSGAAVFSQKYYTYTLQDCYGLTELSDTNIVYVGDVVGHGYVSGYELYLLRVSALGVPLAEKFFGSGNSYDGGFGIMQASNGTVGVTGRTMVPSTSSPVVIWLLMLTPNLDLLLQRTYVYDYFQGGRTINITDDGAVVIGGYAYASSCSYDYFLIVDNCGPGLFKDGATCKPCITNCSVCNSADECDKCVTGNFLHIGSSDGSEVLQCVSSCPGGSFVQAGVCEPCVLNCTACTGKNVCSKCLDDNYWLRNTTGEFCISECPADYFATADKKCMTGNPNCAPNCFDCLVMTFCYSCVPNYFPYNDAPNNATCLPCIDSCYNCTNNLTCDICNTGFFKHAINDTANECIASCPAGTYADRPAMICQNCLKNCSECTGSSDCVMCESGFYIDTISTVLQSCINPCRPGYYNDANSKCQKCLDNCKNCTSGTRCIECNSTYYLKYSTEDATDSCVTDCGPRYYPHTNKTCIECDFRCLACNGTTPDMCPLCDTGKQGVEVVGALKCNCSKGYMANLTSRACQPCDDVFCKLCDQSDAGKCYECTKDYPGLTYNHSTFQCDCPAGTFKEAGTCISCNSLCGNCTGPSSTECSPYSCGTHSYPMADAPTTCLYMCNYNSPTAIYYLDADTNLCKELICHPSCRTCTGTTNSECIYCTDPTAFQFKGTCKPSCPSSYYASADRVCLECGGGCKTCNDSSTCVACILPLLLQDGVCVEKCFKGRYVTAEYTCGLCKYPCLECGSPTRCWRCANGYYLYAEECWTGVSRPQNVYAVTNSTGGIFLPCHSACVECTGAGHTNCVDCNEAAGYIKVAENTCQEPECGPGYYKATVSNVTRCFQCPEPCATCSGNSSKACFTCAPDYFQSASTGAVTIFCQKCSDLNPGLKTDPTSPGKCTEICGDGVNLGYVECDDGNKFSGDGCSAECKVETGFECRNEENKADYCYTTAPPRPTLKVYSNNTLVGLTFSRPIVLRTTLEELMGSVKPALVRVADSCAFELKLLSSYYSRMSKGSTFSKLEFRLQINCSLSGAESLRLTFSNPSRFADENSISMITERVAAKLVRNKFLSALEEAVTTTAGSGFESTNLAILCFSLAQYLLQSVALGSFWALVNMLQILFYTPVIESHMPDNLLMILTKYLSVTQMRIPVQIDLKFFLPDGWVDELKSSLLSMKLQEFGLSSMSFLYNFYQQFFTWIILVACYLVLVILDSIRPESRFLFIPRWKQDYVYNAVIRVVLETYLDMTFYSLLNIFFIQTSNSMMIVSSIVATVAFSLALIFICICLLLTSSTPDEYAKPDFKAQYSTLVEEFEVAGGPFRRGFYCVFLMRRLVFVVVLIAISNRPVVQLGLSIALDLLMALYIALLGPYRMRFDNYLNIFNELVIAFVHVMMLIINRNALEGSKSEKIIGWICVSLILLSALQVWVHMLLPLMQTIGGYASRLYRKLAGDNTRPSNNAEEVAAEKKPSKVEKDKHVNADNKKPREKKRKNTHTRRKPQQEDTAMEPIENRRMSIIEHIESVKVEDEGQQSSALHFVEKHLISANKRPNEQPKEEDKNMQKSSGKKKVKKAKKMVKVHEVPERKPRKESSSSENAAVDATSKLQPPPTILAKQERKARIGISTRKLTVPLHGKTHKRIEEIMKKMEMEGPDERRAAEEE